MTADWKSRLGASLKSAEGRRTKVRSPGASRLSMTPLAINLGIDYGTSFTKICYRDVGTEKTGIVTFREMTLEGAMIPSVVTVSNDGTLILGPSVQKVENETNICYLKMRLDDLCRSDGSTALKSRLPTICGIDLNTKNAICAMATWFLATVIAKAKSRIKEKEQDLAIGRELQWSANVGVPVEYCDSPSIEIFRKVLAIAWAWESNDNIPTCLYDAIKRYQIAEDEVELDKTDCHAIPEIAAAVQSFLTSREAVPGIYVYFDIGGGTVDGVVFNYINWNGDRHINFLSGKVLPLGVSEIAARVHWGGKNVEKALANGAIDSSLKNKLSPISQEMRRLVGTVIMTAKRKDPRDWQKERIQGEMPLHNVSSRRDIAGMAPLRIFLGGGGAGSQWYKRAILSTYKENNHDSAGIPPYKLAEVPCPVDLDLGQLAKPDFRRYVVAHGLSVPYGEGLESNLPKEFPEIDPLPPQNVANVVDYSNNKDVYD
jgi:hypothetical protein